MAKYRVAMIDYDYDSLENFERVLAQYDAQLDAQRGTTIEAAAEFARGADGVMVQKLGPVDEAFIAGLGDQCRVLGRTGIGLDPIDVAAATKHGKLVTHVPNYCSDEVSDHAMALLLTVARKTCAYNASVKGGTWDYNVAKPIFRLRGRTVGLIGFGKIPRRVAPKAQGFGMKVVAFDPFVDADAMAVEKLEMDALLARADFVSIHAPLVAATQGLFGAEQFRAMKETAFIINTSRGPLIQEDALIAALKNGEIAGAGLDVMSAEPPAADNPLYALDNVVLTPHAGYYSEESSVDLHEQLAHNVGLVLHGKRPHDIANPEVLEKLALE